MSARALHQKNIIKSAIRLFRQSGYTATGLNDILRASGAPKGSLYYYFPKGKEQLGAEAVTAAGKTVSKTLNELSASTETAEEFFTRYCDMLTYWAEKSNFTEGCPISNTLLEMSNSSVLISQAGQKVFTKWREIMTNIFIRDGIPAVQAEANGAFMLSSIQGALLVCRVEKSTSSLKRLPEMIAPLFADAKDRKETPKK